MTGSMFQDNLVWNRVQERETKITEKLLGRNVFW